MTPALHEKLIKHGRSDLVLSPYYAILNRRFVQRNHSLRKSGRCASPQALSMWTVRSSPWLFRAWPFSAALGAIPTAATAYLLAIGVQVTLGPRQDHVPISVKLQDLLGKPKRKKDRGIR